MSALFFEISPMFENQLTGIPIVTSELVRCAVADPDASWTYLYQNIIVDRAVVEEMLARRRGGDYLAHLERQLWAQATLDHDDAAKGACIFPNVKPLRNVFRSESLILHDLSTLLTPEFHNLDTILYHTNRIRPDIATSDFIFCVSDSTMQDLNTYFPESRGKSGVIPMGIRMDPCILSELILSRSEVQFEPYICVLGTIEPRKNGAMVFDLLTENRELLSRYKIVFVGRDGWNDAKGALLGRLREAGLDTDRVVFAGFVSEDAKLKLLANCSFCIYPSFFEGYGIPVAEAAVLGKYVVCSNSSSLPEVAPEMSFFFDPLDVASLSEAVYLAEKASRLTRLNDLSYLDINAKLKQRDWGRAYTMVRDRMLLGAAA